MADSLELILWLTIILMQTKKIESVSQAWAFVKLCEMIAGRLLTELIPGETAEFKVENVSTIYLEVFPPDKNR